MRPLGSSRAGGSARDDAVTLRLRAETAAAGLPELMLAAERLAVTVDPGAHGLRRAGTGEDFWQYRPALQGDPAGLIDWRRSARSDAAFVRERERQAPQSAALWVSGTPGMAWTGDAARPAKGDRARLLALALGLLLLRGGERVGIGAADAKAGRAQAEVLGRDLLATGADLPGAGTLRSHRRVVLVGDFLGDLAPLRAFMADAAALGCPGALMQVLDPVEESFPFGGAVRFRSPGGRTRAPTRAGSSRVSTIWHRPSRRPQRMSFERQERLKKPPKW